ncbi:MAG: DinB family protein [Chloroflexi bacterium]|nr:DinB family protein [Chloroflexota bacterium]
MVTETSSPRQNVFTLLKANRKLLIDAIDGLSPEQMIVAIDGDWSVKDILTHVVSWDELILPDLRRLGRGRVPTLASNPGEATDKWNDLLMAFRRNLPLDQVIEEFAETRAEVIAVLGEMSADRFLGGHVVGHCQVAALHDWEHARQITEWRSKVGA